MSQHDRYISPFSTRYASDEMQYIFSDDNKFRTWRRLWVALARAEMKQGLTNITPEMVAELEAHVDDINYEVAIEREKLVRHDVMSHVYAYGQQCPKAAGIIHLGATSCYVGDNAGCLHQCGAAFVIVGAVFCQHPGIRTRDCQDIVKQPCFQLFVFPLHVNGVIRRTHKRVFFHIRLCQGPEKSRHWLHHTFACLILLSGPASQDQAAACFHIGSQHFCPFLCED